MKVDPRNFIGCNHTRKEKYGVFHRCADCKYHFCYDDEKYSHPDQYKDCEHLVKDDIFSKLTCLRCGLRFGSIFSTCEHRRKKRFFDYSDFYCCADCEYHFVNGDPKYRHPNQYENCEHTDQRMVDNQLVCLQYRQKITWHCVCPRLARVRPASCIYSARVWPAKRPRSARILPASASKPPARTRILRPAS